MNFKKEIFINFVFLSLFFPTNYVYSQKRLLIYELNQDNNNYVISFNKFVNDSASIHKTLQEIIFKDYSKGYVLAGFDSIIYTDTIVNAYYNRGDKFLFGELNIECEDSIFLSKRKGLSGNMDNQKLFNYLNSILLDYVNNGYPFTTIRLNHISFLDNKFNATVEIENGNKYFFDSIFIKGEAKIKEYYLRKFTGLKQGEIFSQKKLTQFEKKLSSITFIEQENPMQIAFSDSTVDIILYLKNKKNSSFNGFIGFIPNYKNTGKMAVTGDLNLSMLNSFGLGESYAVKWQKFENLSQFLQMDISFPYIFKSDFGTGGYLKIEKRDSSFVNTDFSGKIIYGSNIENGIDLTFRSASSRVLLKNNTQIDIKNYKLNLFGINYRHINVDNFRMPSKGIIYVTGAYAGSKSIFQDDDSVKLLQLRANIDFSFYIPLYRSLSLKIRNKSSVIYSKEILLNELDYIGGLNTIRGFDEQSIPTSSYSFFNNEVRYIFDKTSALFIFADLAYSEKRFTAEDSHNYFLGTGIGLELETNAGIFTIVYAIGKQNQQAFNFSNSKIHFGYKSYF